MRLKVDLPDELKEIPATVRSVWAGCFAISLTALFIALIALIKGARNAH